MIAKPPLNRSAARPASEAGTGAAVRPPRTAPLHFEGPADDPLLVTGAAGFIGARLVRSCRLCGIPVIAVDRSTHFTDRPEHWPLPEMTIDRDRLFDWLQAGAPRLRAIIHLGACTNTLETDEAYLTEMNTEYSKHLWLYATQMRIPFLYASSAATYGDGAVGYDDDERQIPLLRPLNPYGRSKHAFDLWALERAGRGASPPCWAGFKFFNVYGFGERHKGPMASMVLQAFDQIRHTGRVRLFRSHRLDVPNGLQRRDFIAVEDVVAILRETAERRIGSGIYNLGTGRARTFLDLAYAVFRALGAPPNIEWIDTPGRIRAHYQYETQARMGKLRREGIVRRFRSLETGVTRYVATLQREAERAKT